MNYRDYLQQLIYKIINPLIHGMIKIGITPNFITTTGFILNVVAAGMFVYAGICGGQNDLSILGWAGGVILFAGLFDMMDGRVARLGNMSSKFGALYDSVLDRYSVDDFLRYMLLFVSQRLFHLRYHCFRCPDRFADGELCACPR